MNVVYLLMSSWKDGYDVFNTVHKVYQKRAAADHQAILLNEAKVRPEILYYVTDYLVED